MQRWRQSQQLQTAAAHKVRARLTPLENKDPWVLPCTITTQAGTMLSQQQMMLLLLLLSEQQTHTTPSLSALQLGVLRCAIVFAHTRFAHMVGAHLYNMDMQMHIAEDATTSTQPETKLQREIWLLLRFVFQLHLAARWTAVQQQQQQQQQQQGSGAELFSKHFQTAIGQYAAQSDATHAALLLTHGESGLFGRLLSLFHARKQPCSLTDMLLYGLRSFCVPAHGRTLYHNNSSSKAVAVATQRIPELVVPAGMTLVTFTKVASTLGSGLLALSSPVSFVLLHHDASWHTDSSDSSDNSGSADAAANTFTIRCTTRGAFVYAVYEYVGAVSGADSATSGRVSTLAELREIH